MQLRRRAVASDQEQGVAEEDVAEFVGSPHSTPRNLKAEVSLLSLPEAAGVYAVLLSVFFLLAFGAYGAHYRLPKPIAVDAPLARFSEGRARAWLEKLVAVGFRWSGTKACDVTSVNLILSALDSISAEHGKDNSTGAKPFEVEVHRGSGSFYLHFLDSILTNSYSNITNIDPIRVSCQLSTNEVSPVMIRLPATTGRRGGQALLLNSHFDSGLQSLGASDAGSGVTVLLEVLRNLLASKAPRDYDAIFLLNGAEEAILCGAHLFTNHPWAKDVRAVINLEAVGAGGAEILFQVNSEALSAAYSAAAPYPHGAVLAAEVFSSGAIPSDTDFRIFRDLLGVPGLDMAFYSNGYVYHTTIDDMEAITPGSLQHMGENVLAVSAYLLDQDRSQGILAAIPEAPSAESAFSQPLVFFDFYGFIVRVPHRVARGINLIVLAGAVAWVWLCSRSRPRSLAPNRVGGVATLLKHIGAVIGCSLSAMLSAALAAGVCVFLLGSTMFFYAHRWMGVVSFGFPALLGLTCAARFFVMRAQAAGKKPEASVRHTFASGPVAYRGEMEQELRVLDVQHFYWLALISLCAAALAVTSALDLGSAGLFSIWLLGLVGGHAAAAVYEYYRWKCEAGEFDESESETDEHGSPSQRLESKPYRYHLRLVPGDVGLLQFRGLLWTKTARVLMFVFVLLPMLITLHLWFSVFDMLVPTLGRTGYLVPGNVVMAVAVAFMLLVTIMPAIPFLLAAGNLTKVIRVLVVLSVTGLLATTMCAPFDDRHPRRMFVQHVNRLEERGVFGRHDRLDDLESMGFQDVGEQYIVAAVLDSGPGVAASDVFPPYAQRTHVEPEGDGTSRKDLHNIYPFDSHLVPPIKYVGVPPPTADIFSSGRFEHILAVIEADNYDPKSDTRTADLAIHMQGFEYANLMIDATNGRLKGWSLSPQLPPTPCGHYFIRHLNGRGAGPWKFQLKFSGRHSHSFSINAAHFRLTEALRDIDARMPSSVSPTMAYVETTEWIL